MSYRQWMSCRPRSACRWRCSPWWRRCRAGRAAPGSSTRSRRGRWCRWSSRRSRPRRSTGPRRRRWCSRAPGGAPRCGGAIGAARSRESSDQRWRTRARRGMNHIAHPSWYHTPVMRIRRSFGFSYGLLSYLVTLFTTKSKIRWYRMTARKQVNIEMEHVDCRYYRSQLTGTTGGRI